MNSQVWMEKELKRELKIVAVTESRTLTEVANEAAAEYLARRQNPSYTAARAGSDKVAGTDGNPA